MLACLHSPLANFNQQPLSKCQLHLFPLSMGPVAGGVIAPPPPAVAYKMQLRVLTFPGEFSLTTSKALVSLHAGLLSVDKELATLALHRTIWCYERLPETCRPHCSSTEGTLDTSRTSATDSIKCRVRTRSVVASWSLHHQQSFTNPWTQMPGAASSSRMTLTGIVTGL
jgi:hypothetical protein